MIKILSLDPSLTCTGWSLSDLSGGEIKVKRAGRIMPDRKIPTRNTGARIDSIVDQAQHIIVEHLFNELEHLIIIEMPSTRKTSRHKGDGAGLANYGSCVGAVRQMCRAISGRVISVKSDFWTGGRSKEKRKKNACRYYKHLTKIKDPGYDVSDAISLAIWWCQIGRKKQDFKLAQV